MNMLIQQEVISVSELFMIIWVQLWTENNKIN
jgi:hypothetical protein